MNHRVEVPSLFPALLAFNLILYGIAGYYFDTGLPVWVMVFIGVLIGLLVTTLLFFLFRLLGSAVNRLPLRINTAVLAALTSLVLLKSNAFRWPDQLFYPVILIGILLAVLVYYAWRRLMVDRRSAWAWSAIVVAVGFLLAGLYWLRLEGEDPYSADLPGPWEPVRAIGLAEGGLDNPAETGPYQVRYFTYGSGEDKQREEFAGGATYVTPTVDATALLPEWKGKKKKWRERYWGFGVGNFPLNGRAYVPEGEGPFPLILVVHGNHGMIDHSDGGYAYLGELLASRGFITVSVDENFINGHWSGDFRGREMPVRAWLLLKHLEQWQTWNDEAGHDLFTKADMDNILLIGHSRGGEAVSIAAAFNRLPYFPDDATVPFQFNFNIKGIVAIAPTDYRYHRQISLKNINFLSLQGSYDADETSFWGMRAYRRLQFTDGGSWFKAGVYIHRANHGQFNSSWGRSDFGGPFQWLLNRGALIPGADQRMAAKVFISAFAEAALRNRGDYLPLFKDAARGRDWLPENYYLTNFADANSRTIVDFEDDLDLTTAGKSATIRAKLLKVWREEELQTRDGGDQQNKVAILGWDYGMQVSPDSPAVYEIILADSTRLPLDTTASVRIALAKGDPKDLKREEEPDGGGPEPIMDLRLVLVDSLGREADLLISTIKPIAPILKTRFTKLQSLDRNMASSEWEVQLETFHLPFIAFNRPADFDPSVLRQIRLVFDQTAYGVLAVDDIGFEIVRPVR